MKRAPLYSRSRPLPARSAEPEPIQAPPAATDEVPASPMSATPSEGKRLSRLRGGSGPFIVAALVLGGIAVGQALHPVSTPLTQRDIDDAVRHSLEEKPLPSAYARAYAAVQPSVVRVIGLDDADTPSLMPKKAKPGRQQAKVEKDKTDRVDPSDKPEQGSGSNEDARLHKRSTGTGVVIIDNGTILTNLHVVTGAKKIRVTFFDGHESTADLIGAQPENDLAVLRAQSLPDDLQAATMRGTADLMPGDQVLAVGFPFGLGPSSSGGIVSGLKRQFRSPSGEKLTNLIQFDAAANPGNSGGPLVTMDGAVVGIVTAILNPGDAGTFIGIGFAMPIENAAAAAGMPPF